MRLENEVKLDYKDVLFKPKRSTLGSRKDVNLTREYKFKWSGKTYKGIPIMASNMDGVGTFAMADALGAMGLYTCLVKTYSVEELNKYFMVDESTIESNVLRKDNTAVSIGITYDDLEKFRIVDGVTGGISTVCVDVANGYTEFFSNYIRKLREEFPSLTIIAGNVCSADQTQELILSGADIVKVGIGPGSVCTTRIQTGVGYPQLSAVIECADVAHGLNGHIIADGGCVHPGDVSKAFGAGADFVMLGGMLAGHDEGGGEVITKMYETNEHKLIDSDLGEVWKRVTEEKQFVQFYGMSSREANEKHFGGLREYRAPEGRHVSIPYKGSVKSTIQEILGGIRSTCTYIGAPGLKQISKCTTFIRCNDTHNRVYE